ncbi:hypothetical protein GCM10010112_94240 [Actinoplanes lobatus]|uniref:Uncharacterized protein n=1 Tax=Actinoplanes lobatus TaxID=113568 RepID=A0A7W7MGW8_9ACTN|nr:hypothetical protein [Actinoplanes lobatus]MBB4749882.1 hypothetical protein [Actinoplanes lobatus]GGN99984.1 hypothetical protein GCM10010112_94240 [Actinoplanes lobatus]GIE46460.1 hypothetical protein Alo02nite_93580 [Actinoplanes lobatus]
MLSIRAFLATVPVRRVTVLAGVALAVTAALTGTLAGDSGFGLVTDTVAGFGWGSTAP